VARVNALLRRAYGEVTTSRLRLGELHLDLRAHRVYVGDTEVYLGPTEFRLLRLFLANLERVFPGNCCWIRFGVDRSMWKNAPWMCTSAVCGAAWSNMVMPISLKRCAARVTVVAVR